MEKFDISRTSWQAKGMIPSINDEVTFHWARKVTLNTINGYGLIGTVRLDSKDLFWINLGLQHIYDYPPEVYMIYKSNDFNSFMDLNHCHARETLTGLGAALEYNKRIVYALTGNLLGLRANLGTSDYIDVFFKIHCC